MSPQNVLIHTRWQQCFSQCFQQYSEQMCSAQTFSRTMWLLSPSHHNAWRWKALLYKYIWLSSKPLRCRYSSSCPQCLHLSVCLLICNTGIKPLPDCQLIRMLRWGKSVGALWHHTKVERHGGDVMRRQITIYAVSVWLLFPPSFTDKAFPEIRQMNGEGCRRCLCFQTTLGGGRSDIPRGSHAGTVLQAPASEQHCLKQRKHLHHTTKASRPAPHGPAEKHPHRCPGCPQAPAGSSVTAIAWQQAHSISAHQSSSAVFFYIKMLEPVNIRNISDNIRERPMQVYLSSRIIYADVGTIKSLWYLLRKTLY